MKKTNFREGLGSNLGCVVRHLLSVIFWSSLGPAEQPPKERSKQWSEEQSKPLILFLLGAMVNTLVSSLGALWICACVPVRRKVHSAGAGNRRKAHLPFMSRKRHGRRMHLTSSLRLKGLTVSAGQFKCKICFGCRQDLAFT